MNRSQDLFKKAKRDFSKAELDYQNEYFEWCCFTAQQAAEKAVKTLYLHLNMNVRGHSITKMLDYLKEFQPMDDSILESAKRLDRYYIESRYPNGFPEGSPYEFFTNSIAKEAINDCRNLIGFIDHYFG